jgi:hypothetical protein
LAVAAGLSAAEAWQGLRRYGVKAVFIMSSERSGSNLLRVMLDNHSRLSGPPAPHLPRILSPLLPYYGDLGDKGNLTTLIEDAIEIVRTNGMPWDVDLTVTGVRQALEDRSLWGVIAALYGLNAAWHGKTGWVCKSSRLFCFVYAIHHGLPAARFVYLARDGRDYAASMHRYAMSPIHPYYAARLWRDEQRACLEIYANLSSTGLVHLIRYEDLISAPEATLRDVCAFLDEPYEPQMLTYYLGEGVRAMAASSVFFRNLDKPVLKSNVGKFKEQLTPSQIELVEAIAGSELTLLGYPRLTNGPLGEPGFLHGAWYALLNAWQVQYRRRRYRGMEPWRELRIEAVRRIRQRVLAGAQPLNATPPLLRSVSEAPVDIGGP